jgi:hypothetical protein
LDEDGNGAPSCEQSVCNDAYPDEDAVAGLAHDSEYEECDGCFARGNVEDADALCDDLVLHCLYVFGGRDVGATLTQTIYGASRDEC